jgi:hypothetical protein
MYSTGNSTSSKNNIKSNKNNIGVMILKCKKAYIPTEKIWKTSKITDCLKNVNLSIGLSILNNENKSDNYYLLFR